MLYNISLNICWNKKKKIKGNLQPEADTDIFWNNEDDVGSKKGNKIEWGSEKECVLLFIIDTLFT